MTTQNTSPVTIEWPAPLQSDMEYHQPELAPVCALLERFSREWDRHTFEDGGDTIMPPLIGQEARDLLAEIENRIRDLSDDIAAGEAHCDTSGDRAKIFLYESVKRQIRSALRGRLMRRVYQVEVLFCEGETETDLDSASLESLAYETDQGLASGLVSLVSETELTPREMAAALRRQGSESSFLLGENDDYSEAE